MAISNKTGRMLLTTGNKSEMAVGYATLYGDMAGGFAPIKDCSKMLVYRLAALPQLASRRVIPQRVIDAAADARSCAPTRRTRDSLPPYEVLDPILEAFIEEDLSVDEIVARGFDRATVARVLDWCKRNEYKRRQAPPGRARQPPRLRPRLALSDHQRLPALSVATRTSTRRASATACDWALRPVVRLVDLARLLGESVAGRACRSTAIMIASASFTAGAPSYCSMALLRALRRRHIGAALHVVARHVHLVVGQAIAQVDHALQRVVRRTRSSGTARRRS